MKKLFILLVICLAMAISFRPGNAQTLNVNEPGRTLVFPLIDNIEHATIINISNAGPDSIYVSCDVITRGLLDDAFSRNGFFIKLSPGEKFWWVTDRAYNKNGTVIPGFHNRKGYMHCSASYPSWNFLLGSALVINPGVFSYNAVPMQFNTVPPTELHFEGFSAVDNFISGKLTVLNLSRYVNSTPQKISLNLRCSSEDETTFSIHTSFTGFRQFDLREDLMLGRNSIFSTTFRCSMKSSEGIWAVFHQVVGGDMMLGNNVWQSR